MNNQRGSRGSWRLFFAVFLFLATWSGLFFPGAVMASTVESHVLYVTQDELYVDMGTAKGLDIGDVGEIQQNGKVVGRGELKEASHGSSRLRLVFLEKGTTLQAGDVVMFKPKYLSKSEEEPSTGSSTNSTSTAEKKPFVPLLAPYDTDQTVRTRADNISHGTLRLRRLTQWDTSHQSDYSLSRLDTNGSFERINGSSWAFVWDGNFSYRDGEAFLNSQDYHRVRTDIFRAIIQRPLARRGFFRMGRFIMNELSGIGVLDGAQVDAGLDQHWRLGGAFGYRPQPGRGSFSSDQPIQSLYGTYEAGRQQGLYCSETLGLMSGYYKGNFDQLALLHDQRVNLGPSFSLNSNLQLDFDVNGSTYEAQSRLSRFNIYANWSTFSFLSFRGGADHYRRPDTQAERASYQGLSSYYDDPGYWRYWGGSSQNLFWNFRLDEELSLIRDSYGGTPTQWQLGLNHAGLPYLPSSSINLTAYNLAGGGLEGYGGIISAQLALMQNKLYVVPSCRVRYSNWVSQTDNRSWELTDYNVRLNWRINRRFGVNLGVAQTFTDYAKTTLADTSLDYRW